MHTYCPGDGYTSPALSLRRWVARSRLGSRCNLAGKVSGSRPIQKLCGGTSFYHQRASPLRQGRTGFKFGDSDDSVVRLKPQP